MYNYQKKLKNQKYKNFKQIKQSNKYLFFCRYFDIKSIDTLLLKNYIINKNIKFKIIKQKLLINEFNVKGQGSLLLFYFNNFNNLKLLNDFIKKNQKIEPLFIVINKQIISILKLNKIFKNNLPLPYQLKQPLFTIFKILSNIK